MLQNGERDEPLTAPPPVYQPLNPLLKEIRVLVVKPEPPPSSTPPEVHQVECSFRYISLQPPNSDPIIPAYEAVSYVWSLVPGTAEILLDGRPFTVPAAAEQVLRNMRFPYSSGGDDHEQAKHIDRERILWIDAICINQTDIPERNHQVGLMGDVYSHCSAVLIWLGEADSYTGAAIDSLNIIHDQLLAETSNAINLRKVLYGSTNIFQYSSTPLPISKINFPAIREIFSRPWFTRRWVVQESALPRTGTIYCGRANQIDMLKFFRAAVWIQHKQHTLPFDLDREQGMLNASYMSAHVDHQQGWFSESGGQRRYLADLFRYFCTFEVTEGRDRVYALLGLSGFQRELNGLLRVDYERPLGEVLRDATRCAIQESGDLWLFRYVEHGTVEFGQRLGERVPSWVPSLFRKADGKLEPSYMRSAFRANLGLESGGLGGMDIDGDPDVLVVKGLVVDTVVDFGPVYREKDLGNVEGLAKVLCYVLVRRVLGGSRTGNLEPDTALVKLLPVELGLVLVAGSTFDPRPVQTTGSSDGQEDTFEGFVQAVMNGGGNLQGLEDQDSELRVKNVLGAHASFSRYTWAIKYAALNRRLFVTAGGFVGLGPQAMREGDALCILSDSRLPMILRRSAGEEWNVLGPCYAHGVMRGDVIKASPGKAKEVVQFCLR
ncbi:Heterokaryon incompatibility protein (HET) domain containing protein [Rhypophila decipiens]